MCMLTFFPADVQPDLERLRNGSRTNRDGHGYAIVADDAIIMGHSLDFEEALAEFATMRIMYPEGPALFHSRYTTHGTSTLDNVHPYVVKGRTNMVLAHNGVLDTDAQPDAYDLRSDTRILAEDIMWKRYPALDSPRTRRRFEKWLTGYNKVVVLTTDPRYKETAYIFNEKSGEWADGIWYSNTGYLPYRPLTTYTGGTWRGTHGIYGGGWSSAPRDDDYEWRSGWVRSPEGIWKRRDEIDMAEVDAMIADYESRTWHVDAEGSVYYSTDGKEGSYPPVVEGNVLGHAPGEEQCPNCRQWGYVSPELRYCRGCEHCAACEAHLADCLCYEEGGALYDPDVDQRIMAALSKLTEGPGNAA
jgi:hypothetical protein